MAVNYEDVKQSPEIRTYITQADVSLTALGFTEHARTIPILIGTVLGEFVFYMLGMDKYALSEEELYSMGETISYGIKKSRLTGFFFLFFYSKRF